MFATTIDSIPPLVLGGGLIVTSFLVAELGFRIGRKTEGKRGLNHYPVEAATMTALLGLFAFLLAFSFGTASSRYSKNRELALEDANILETTYLRADFLPDPEAQKSKALLLEFLEVRVEAVAKQEPQFVAQALARCNEIQRELWQIATSVVNGPDQPASVRLYVTSLNELIDNASRREWLALYTRFPLALWLTLALLGVICACMIGLSAGLHGRPARLATTTLLGAFTMVVVLIIDLDRPFRTLVTGRLDPNSVLLARLQALDGTD